MALQPPAPENTERKASIVLPNNEYQIACSGDHAETNCASQKAYEKKKTMVNLTDLSLSFCTSLSTGNITFETLLTIYCMRVDWSAKMPD